MLLVAAILTFGCQFAVTGFVASAATSKLSASDNHCDSRFIASLESSDSKDFLQIRKLLRRRGGSPPPPPPPPLAVDAMSIGFAVVSVLMMAGLLACELGVLPPVSIASRHVWLIFPLSQAYLHMAAYGVGPLTGASPRMGAGGNSLFAIFSALVVQAACFILTCKLGPRSNVVHVMYPPTAIYLLAWSYYLHTDMGSSPIVSCDVFGLEFHPLHMILWMCSTSVQCILWKQIHHIQCVGGPFTPFHMPAGSMFLALIMLWLGLLGSLDFAALRGDAPMSWTDPSWDLGLTIGLNAGSFASFYALLTWSTAPIIDATEHYLKLYQQRAVAHAAHPTAATQASLQNALMTRRQFMWARRYVWVTWHGFPLVWGLGAAGIVGSEMREYLWMACDLAAKFLPVSMYISLLSVY